MSQDPIEPGEGNWKDIVDGPPMFGGNEWDPERDGCFCLQLA